MSAINERLEDSRRVNHLSENPPFPRLLKLDTCNTCNYTCIFCPHAKQGKKYGPINHELCLRLIKEGYEAGARECSLAGSGEPLINTHLEEYITYARELGYEYIFLNTNGYLATPERIKSIIDANPDNIKFSINSGREKYEFIHGVEAYDKVIANLRSAVEYRNATGSKCQIYGSFVATRLTLDDAEDMRDILAEITDGYYVMNANNRGGKMNEVDDLLFVERDENAYKYPCAQMFENAYVTSEGYMFICCQDFDNETVVADLNNTSLTEAWNSDRFREVRRRHLNKDFEGSLCYNCLNDKSEPVLRISPEIKGYSIDNRKLDNLLERIKKLGCI